jgi:hypothetical protein
MLHILNKGTNNPDFNPLLYWLGHELDKHEIRVRFPTWQRLSSPSCPDWLRSLPSLISYQYLGLFPQG